MSENVSCPLVDSAIFYFQYGPNKGRPISLFCKRVGHITDICYKKHEFLPGFTSKGKVHEKFQKPRPIAAHVALSHIFEVKNANLEGMIENLTKDHIQQFIVMFSSHLQIQHVNQHTEASTSHFAIENSGILSHPPPTILLVF